MNPTALQSALNALNTAFEADPVAIHALIRNVVPCNQILADHPTVQVQESIVPWKYEVSALGLLNGVIEAMTGGRVAAKFSDTPNEIGVHPLVGFCEYVPPQE